MLVVLSVIGYGFLRAGWPRAPFVIGLILGGQAEGSLNQALQLWGFCVLHPPAVAGADRHDRGPAGLFGLSQLEAQVPNRAGSLIHEKL